MNKQAPTPRRERQIRFAEAGILFVLILGIAIFVGLGIRSGDEPATETAAVAVLEEPVVEIVVEDSAAAGTTPVTAAVVETAVAEPEPVEPVVVTYAMAEAVYHEGRYADAADLFARYTDTRPDNAWGLYMLGLSAWKAGEPEAADDAFAAALELDPDHFKSLVNHARVLLDLARDDEAAGRIETALAAVPGDPEALRVQGRILHRQGRLAEAEAAYEAVLRADAGDVWALNNLGLIRIEQERFAEALAPLAKASSLADAACIRNNLGIALERTGHYTAAAEAYEAAIAADSGHELAAVSLERVDGLGDDVADEPVDLALLAERFTVVPVLATGDAGPADELAVAAMTPSALDAGDAPADEEAVDDERDE